MHPTKKIGLIAGGGEIPPMLVKAWLVQGMQPVVLSLDKAQTAYLQKIDGCIVVPCTVGQAGKIVDTFRQYQVDDIVLIGTIPRPNFWTLRTDALGFKIILKILFQVMGDNRLLTFMRRQLETFGFTIHAAQEYLPDILCPEGVLGTLKPSDDDKLSILQGIHAVRIHGEADKGQAVVVCDGQVIGYEDAKGTNALIKKFADIHGRKILVKMAKPQQDMALDAPTIGVRTIEHLHSAGFSGLVVEAERTIVVEQHKVIALCEKYKMLFIGMKGHTSS